MTQDELDAIPDDVWVEAHDVLWPDYGRTNVISKISDAQDSGTCQVIARVLMQLRAQAAEIAALKGDGPDLLAARKIAADHYYYTLHEKHLGDMALAGDLDGWPMIECALAGIKHGRGEG